MNTDKTIAEKIASEYAVKEESKVTALKKLDRKAKMPASVFAYVYGSLMALVLGVGISMSLGKLGSGTATFVFGIIIGLIGIAGVSTTHIFYEKILKKSKIKYANDIIRLAKEITEE